MKKGYGNQRPVSMHLVAAVGCNYMKHTNGEWQIGQWYEISHKVKD